MYAKDENDELMLQGKVDWPITIAISLQEEEIWLLHLSTKLKAHAVGQGGLEVSTFQQLKPILPTNFHKQTNASPKLTTQSL